MDVSLLNPNSEAVGLNDATVEPPLGLAYLASVLENNGYRSEIIDANALGLDSHEAANRISRNSRLVGIHVNSFCFDSAQKTARLLRQKRPEMVIVLGGPAVSASPETILENISCHGVVRGEGEDAILKIMNNISRGCRPFDKKIPGGAYFSEDNDLVMNPIERIPDLDRLPFPAHHLLPPFNVYKSRCRKRPSAAIITSRGCAHQCIFCSKDVFKRRVTFRSAENVLEEIDLLVRRFGVRQVDILDDNFLHRRDRVMAIADGLIERNYGLAINLQSGVRCEKLDEEILKRMRQAGFYKIGFGIESADPEVLRICRKHLDLDRIQRTARMAKGLGFEVYGFFIIGLPGETEDSFRKTLDFARRLDLDVANFTLAVPFIGTELYRMVQESGRFLIDTSRNIAAGFYGRRVFFEYGDNRQEDILRRFDTAYKEFYSLRKKMTILLNTQSLGELQWLWDAARVVLKGVFARERLRFVSMRKALIPNGRKNLHRRVESQSVRKEETRGDGSAFKPR